jgi:hypothetical protein
MAGRCHLDLRVTGETYANGEATIRPTASGTGQHAFALRTDNLAVYQPEKELALRPERRVVWFGRVESSNATHLGWLWLFRTASWRGAGSDRIHAARISMNQEF